MADLRDRYLPCPEHPDAGVRRHQAIVHTKKGDYKAEVVVTCDRCGRWLQRKPKKSP